MPTRLDTPDTFPMLRLHVHRVTPFRGRRWRISQGRDRWCQGAPVSVETILVPDQARRGARTHPGMWRVPYGPALSRRRHHNDFPFLLGHEASGIVEKVGRMSPMWRPAILLSGLAGACGTCRSCLRGGHVLFCSRNAQQKMTARTARAVGAIGIGLRRVGPGGCRQAVK